MIEIPDFEWFINKQSGGKKPNTFSGSFGVDGKSGCLNRETLNYKITLTDDKTVCSCYILKPWSENCETEKFAEAEFSKDEKGISDAKDFLNKQAELFKNR